MRYFGKTGGFTLIELLIVVAIIAILALIAVPNFLEAQVRSKVSRVKSDMRSLATGMEAYRVDWNGVPPWDSWADAPGDVAGRRLMAPGHLWWALTTPIAYITAPFRDAFVAIGTHSSGEHSAGDANLLLAHLPVGTGYVGPASAGAAYTHWCACSYGPDCADDQNGLGIYPYTLIAIPYDPTNGTVSWGDVFRHGGKPPSNFLDDKEHSNVTNAQGVGDPWSWVK
jgi:prepilin-type N-terminal cleavage/methylation domain-containing protein